MIGSGTDPSDAPWTYCRSCGRKEHGSTACQLPTFSQGPVEAPSQWAGRTLRVMDGRLWVVDPGIPPVGAVEQELADLHLRLQATEERERELARKASVKAREIESMARQAETAIGCAMEMCRELQGGLAESESRKTGKPTP